MDRSDPDPQQPTTTTRRIAASEKGEKKRAVQDTPISIWESVYTYIYIRRYICKGRPVITKREAEAEGAASSTGSS